MNRTVNILLLVTALAIGLNLWGQQAKGKTDSKTTAAKGTKLLIPTVFLGNSDLSGGAIKKDRFDQLLQQGLTSRDSMGNKYRVMGFQFSYAERSFYEDSVGNPISTIDYAYEYCPGDTISTGVAAVIYDRSKAGDTIYFDRISLIRLDKKTNQPQAGANVISGRSMKFAIVR